MKRVFYPGKRVKAPCDRCDAVMQATYDYGPVPYKGTVVEGVMRATCDVCGQVVATAQQSAPLFRAAVANKPRTQQVSVRIPRVLADVARLELAQNQATDVERFDLLVKAFALSITGSSEKRWAQAAEKLRSVSDPVLSLPNDCQIPMYLNDRLRDLLGRLQHAAGLPSIAELVRRILVLMESDKKAVTELRKLLLAG